MKHNGDRCQPLERPHFVTGQILTADDLRAEQDYQREVRRRHNRLCHGWGIVDGLGVRWDTTAPRVVVGPGFAISPRGDEICVHTHAELELGPRTATCRVAFVAVRATETLVSPVPVVDPEDPDAFRYSRSARGFRACCSRRHAQYPPARALPRISSSGGLVVDAPACVRTEAALARQRGLTSRHGAPARWMTAGLSWRQLVPLVSIVMMTIYAFEPTFVGGLRSEEGARNCPSQSPREARSRCRYERPLRGRGASFGSCGSGARFGAAHTRGSPSINYGSDSWAAIGGRDRTMLLCCQGAGADWTRQRSATRGGGQAPGRSRPARRVVGRRSTGRSSNSPVRGVGRFVGVRPPPVRGWRSGRGGGGAEVLEGFAGDVALEDADDLAGRLAVGAAPGDVVAGRLGVRPCG